MRNLELVRWMGEFGAHHFLLYDFGKITKLLCVILSSFFKGPSPWQRLLAFHTSLSSPSSWALYWTTLPSLPCRTSFLVVKILWLAYSESKCAASALVLLHPHSSFCWLQLGPGGMAIGTQTKTIQYRIWRSKREGAWSLTGCMMSWSTH